MNKKFPWKAVALALALLLLSSCGSAEAPPDPTTKPGSWDNINQDIGSAEGWRRMVEHSPFGTQSTYPRLDGSTSMVPLAIECARQHLGLGEAAAKQLAEFSTTSAAYERLFGREIDLFLGTTPGEEDLRLAAKQGITPVQKPICWDSLMFITHRDNPVDNLSVRQLRDIFSGKTRRWNEVGGPDMPIRAFQREAGAGSQTGMEKLVMQGTPMADPALAPVVTGMGPLVDAVADPSAFGIGYTYAYYIENLYKNENVKSLRVDGVASSDAAVVSGAYPLRLERFGVIRRGDEKAIGGRFLDWLLSEEGQACVKQAGYIPVGAVAR